jgi:thioredoxin:protein disulfide reductase
VRPSTSTSTFTFTWALLSVTFPACHTDPPPAAGGPIRWSLDHDAAIEQAKQARQPVMIDFTAEWCVPCKQLELETYIDPRVRAEVQRFVAVKIDATEMTPVIEKIFQRYGVESLPTIVFLDSTGHLLSSPRLTRFAPPEAFVQLLQQVK